MNAEQWTTEEAILVLDLYMSKPKGMRPATDEQLVNLAQLLGRTPESLCRRMQKFQQWYPVLPFDVTEPIYNDENPAIWNEYFAQPRKAHKEAPSILEEFCIGTLVLNLYFQLIISTMNEKVPEVVELGKLVKRPAKAIAGMLLSYASLDPFMKDGPAVDLPASSVQRQLWNRYADDMDKLSHVAKYIESHYPKKRAGKRKMQKS